MTDWYDRIKDNVVELDARRKPTRQVILTDELLVALGKAARARGMSSQAYMRRAIAAMVCHDLGLDWDEIMRDEGAIGVGGAAYDKTPARGRGFGRWVIERLR